MVSRLLSSSVNQGAVVNDANPQKVEGLAHREGRTRSLQIATMHPP